MQEISQPISPEDQYLDYLPTQAVPTRAPGVMHNL